MTREGFGGHITAAAIEAARTPAGGWTRETLAGWGIAWPPQKGWKRELIARQEQSAA